MKKTFIFILTIFTLIGFLESCKKEKETWYCPMHPTYTSDKKGQCPICNMNLVKKEITPAKSTSHFEHDHENMSSETNSKKEEHTIYLPEEKQRLIGIKTTSVKVMELNKKIIAYSRVAYDPEPTLITQNYSSFLLLLSQRLEINSSYLKTADTEIIE